MESRIFFEPRVGKHYGEKESIFPMRILVLGDSHYCDGCSECGDRDTHPECANMTANVVRDYLDPTCKKTWKKTFSTFINSVFGRSTTIQDREAFFDSVAFFNFLQVAAGETAYSARTVNYGDPRYLEALSEVKTRLDPDVVIVWGDRVWQCVSAKAGADEVDWIPVHHPAQGYRVSEYHEILTSKGVTPSTAT